VKLTPEIYDEFQTQAGITTRMLLGSVFSQPNWVRTERYLAQETAKSLIDTARKNAEALILARHPEIIDQAYERRMMIIRGEKPPRDRTLKVPAKPDDWVPVKP
jgi:hypothetical protein